MKWLSAFLSVLIVSAFVAFYFWNYGGKKSYARERDQRLVASAARALLDAVQADEPASRVERRGTRLLVTGLATTSSDGYAVELTDVLERVGRPESFAALLVADQSGSVLAQHARVRIDGLRRIVDTDVADKGVPAPAGNAAFAQRPTSGPLRFGETSLLAVCHPTSLPPRPGNTPESATGPSETLVVCGLVDEARRDREAGSVSPLALACLLAIVVLAMLVPPFLKVHMLTRPERLRFADAFALAVCQFLGLMIATTAIFGVAVYYGLTALANAELESVAREVQSHLAAELTGITAQLKHSDEDLARVHPTADVARDDVGLARTGLLTRGLCTAHGPACEPWPTTLPDYPYGESLAWIAPDGRQSVKWWARCGGEMFFDVSRRSYFTDVRDGLVTRAPRGSPWPDAFALASVRAWSNGDVRAVVARASMAGPPPAAPVLAQALTTRLISLSDPVLPAGMGFAVVDGRGDVQFHSDGHLSLAHNLFDETARSPRLRSAVSERAKDTLAARYWGRPYSLHVEPLGPLPWSLVVFREHEWLLAVGVEALAEALLLCLVFTCGVFLLPALTFVGAVGRRTPFPWPNRDLAWLYLYLSATFLIIGALYVWGLVGCHGEEALTLALALPGAALLSVSLVLAGRAWLQQRYPHGLSQRFGEPMRVVAMALAALFVLCMSWFARTPLGLLLGAGTAALLCLALIEGSDRLRAGGWFRIPHRVASTGFWLLFAMLPAVGFVKGATERALDAGANRSLGLFAGRLDERARAVHGSYPDEVHDAPALRSLRLASGWDVYPSSLYSIAWQLGAADECRGTLASVSAPPAGFASWLGTELSALKPYLAEHAVGQRHGRAPRDADGHARARWTLCTATAPGHSVSGGPPAFGEVVGWAPWVALLALALVTSAIVRWAERTLLATGVSALATRSIEAVKSGLHDDTRTVLVTPSGFERRELLAGAWYDALPADPPSAPCTGKPLLVSEAALWEGDEIQRCARLDVLEACTRYGTRAVVVVASRPPSAWLGDLSPLSAPARARWVALLERFEVAVARSPGAADAAIEQRVRTWLGERAESHRRERKCLVEELRASPHVFALCAASIGVGALAEADRRACLRRIEELASGYYRSLWEACSAEERLTLVQLAEEGFVNPRRLDVVEALLAKGLVCFRSALAPMNASFEAFVRRADNAVPLQATEIRGTGFGWVHLRAPLVALGAAAAVFIFVTERSLFDSAAGLSALMVGSVVPLLGQVARAVQNLTRVAQAPGSGGPAPV